MSLHSARMPRLIDKNIEQAEKLREKAEKKDIKKEVIIKKESKKN